MRENLSTAEILRWQLDAGVDETIGNMPINHFAQAPQPAVEVMPSTPLKRAAAAKPSQASASAEKTLHDACASAASANSLEELKAALNDFDGCALKKTATNLVFGDGNPKAKIVLIGEGPGAEEDRQGVPFVGPGGQLLDKMLASIGLDRDAVYISNTVFWRPPGNRTPTSAETALCLPFIERLMELIDPEILITLGGPAAKAMLAETAGVGRLRGKWYEYSTPKLSRPIQATVLFHPDSLISSPGQKRETWSDLLMIRDRIDSLT
ncbi:MAG: uracil-DNA glycosylase [Rhodospirillales bacterium]|nr:uracil-DNA glycosylase [Rhodospirillales bacterium]